MIMMPEASVHNYEGEELGAAFNWQRVWLGDFDLLASGGWIFAAFGLRWGASSMLAIRCT